MTNADDTLPVKRNPEEVVQVDYDIQLKMTSWKVEHPKEKTRTYRAYKV